MAKTQEELLSDIVNELKELNKKVERGGFAAPAAPKDVSQRTSGTDDTKDKESLKKATSNLAASFGMLTKNFGQYSAYNRVVQNASYSTANAFSGMSKTVDSTADALNGIHNVYQNTIGKIPVVGVLFANALTSLAVGAIGHSIDTFNQLSKQGVSFGGSILNMNIAAAQSGLSLTDFAAVVKENALAINVFGTERFADLNKTVRETQSQLYNLGFSTKDIIDFNADFLETQRAVGGIGKLNQMESAQQIGELGNTLHSFSAATGKSVDELRKSFRATSKDNILNSTIANKSIGEQNKLRANLVLLNEVAPQAADGFNSIINGFQGVTSESFRELNQFAPSIASVVRQMDKLDPEDAQKALLDSANNISEFQLQSLRQQAILGNAGAKATLDTIMGIKTGINIENIQKAKERKKGTENLQQLQNVFTQITSSIKTTFFKALGDIDPSIIEAITGGLKSMGEKLNELIKKYLPQLLSALPGFINAIPGVIDGIIKVGIAVGKFVGPLLENFEVLAYTAAGLTAAFIALGVASKIKDVKNLFGGGGIGAQTSDNFAQALKSNNKDLGKETKKAMDDALKYYSGSPRLRIRIDEMTSYAFKQFKDAFKGSGGSGSGNDRGSRNNRRGSSRGGKFDIGSNLLKGGAGLLLTAGAVYVLAKALQEFETVNWESVAMGGVALAGVGAAAFVLGKVLPAILQGSIAIGAMSLAVGAFGLALNLFPTEAFDVITKAVETFGNMFNNTVDGIVKIADIFANSMMGIATIVKDTVLGTLDRVPVILDSLTTSIKNLAEIPFSNLAGAGVGLTALAGGLVAFSAGSGLAAIVTGLSNLFGINVVENLQKFADIDYNKFSTVKTGIQSLMDGLKLFDPSDTRGITAGIYDFVSGGGPISKLVELGKLGEGLSKAGTGVKDIAENLSAFSKIEIDNAGLKSFNSELKETINTINGIKNVKSIEALTGLLNTKSNIEQNIKSEELSKISNNNTQNTTTTGENVTLFTLNETMTNVVDVLFLMMNNSKNTHEDNMVMNRTSNDYLRMIREIMSDQVSATKKLAGNVGNI